MQGIKIDKITVYDFLHSHFNKLKRYKYPYNVDDFSNNGIYVMFEKGEVYNSLDRIVRIGSHREDNNLRKRLNEHFFKEAHRKSVLRKHIGRCLLTQDNQCDYLKYWNVTNKEKKKYQLEIDIDFEKEYEIKITKFIRDRFSFIIIPNLIDKSRRERLEKALIATFAQSDKRLCSKKWLGNFHPNLKIKESKLWNLNHLNDNTLTQQELNYIIDKTEHT